MVAEFVERLVGLNAHGTILMVANSRQMMGIMLPDSGMDEDWTVQLYR